MLLKELIKEKPEVSKLLIFCSGMGCSEFNYPTAEVLPNIRWHLLKSVNDGVHMTTHLSEMKGFAGHPKVGHCRAWQGQVPCLPQDTVSSGSNAWRVSIKVNQ